MNGWVYIDTTTGEEVSPAWIGAAITEGRAIVLTRELLAAAMERLQAESAPGEAEE